MRRFSIILLVFTAICIFATSPQASTIDTEAYWDSHVFLNYFGEGNVQTLGQTFSLEAGDDTMLESITFYMSHGGTTPTSAQFDLHVYEWSGDRAVGTSLYESGPYSTVINVGYQTYTVSAINLQLQLNKDYIWFMSTSNLGDGYNDEIQVGVVWESQASTPYAPYLGGKMEYQSFGYNEAAWTGQAWDTGSSFAEVDIACVMQFVTVPEPATMLLLVFGLLGLARLKRKA